MFWPRLKTIEQTPDLTVLRENPVYFAGVIPFLISLVPLAILLEVPEIRGEGAPAALLAFAMFVMFFSVGLSTFVSSTFSIDRTAGILRIERKLLWWTRKKEYSVFGILTVFEDRTIRGNRLMMQLRSGQVKRFCIYTVYAPLDAQAAMLNGLLHAARQSTPQPPALNPPINQPNPL
jgi:hypothetical protein